MRIVEFYKTLSERDNDRTNNDVPILSPRQKLPPFQVQRLHREETTAIVRIYLVDCDDNETEITSYFYGSNAIFLARFTTYDYWYYKGGVFTRNTGLNLLPMGKFYLRLDDITTSPTTRTYNSYYSNWIEIKDLQTRLSYGWTGETGFSTFTLVDNDITAATNTTGTAYAFSSPFSGEDTAYVNKGDKIIFAGFLALTAGVYPTVELYHLTNGSYSNVIALASGFNEVTLIATQTGVVDIRLYVSAASQFKLYGSLVYKKIGNGLFININFRNTYDLRDSVNPVNDIMYQHSWKQEVYLPTYMNLIGVTESKEGEEYNGIFIPEKISVINQYSIISQQGRALFKALSLLNLHDDITITDEVGNEFTPDPGNITITADWKSFDTCDVKLEFNNGSVTWTAVNENIT